MPATKVLWVGSFVLSLCLLRPAPIHAEPIWFNVLATITHVDAALGSTFAVNELASYSFMYDTGSTTSSFGGGTFGDDALTGRCCYGFVSIVGPDQVYFENHSGAFIGTAWPGGWGLVLFGQIFQFPTGAVSLLGQNESQGINLAADPLGGAFTTYFSDPALASPNGLANGPAYRLSGRVDSVVRTTSVPEPSTLLLLGLGGLALVRRRGVTKGKSHG